MRKIDKIILHCSASPHAHHDNVQTYHQWHVIERKFVDIGYHFIVHMDGKISNARPLKKAGAHAREPGGVNYNTYSIGICFSGLNHFSNEQFVQGVKLCENLISIFNLKVEDVIGHHEVNKNKTCPNFDMELFRDKLRKAYEA